jgi:hypothetical protein
MAVPGYFELGFNIEIKQKFFFHFLDISEMFFEFFQITLTKKTKHPGQKAFQVLSNDEIKFEKKIIKSRNQKLGFSRKTLFK